MEDYELGKLAEELIQSRYSDKLKDKDDEISKLKKELHTLKGEKRYLKESISLFGYGSTSSRVYMSVDDLTKELKESKELNEELAIELKSIKGSNEELLKESNKFKKTLDSLSKENFKLGTFVHRNKLSSFIYKLWGDNNGWIM